MLVRDTEIYRGEVSNHDVGLLGEDGPALLVHPLSDTSDVVSHEVPVLAVVGVRNPVVVHFLPAVRYVKVFQEGIVPYPSATSYGDSAYGFNIAIKHVQVVYGFSQIVEAFNLFFGSLELSVIQMGRHVVVAETEYDMAVHVAKPFENVSGRIELACYVAWDNQNICRKEVGYERIHRHLLSVIVVVKIRKNKGLHTTKIGYEGRIVNR